MAEFTSYDEGTPCWVDLAATDVGEAKEFYAHLFGWEYADVGAEGGGYQIATLRGSHVAGIGARPPEQTVPSMWTTYLWADDADTVAARVSQAGGTLITQPVDVLSAGRMAVAADSTGAVFGIWQGREMIGAQVANEPGACTWNENLNDDPARARAFYAQVFGYTYERVTGWETEYDTFKVNGAVRGGIGAKPVQVPSGTPNFWNTYFSVTDADAAVAVALGRRGRVLVEPTDTPAGRMAVVADPGGAVLSVIAPSRR